MRASAPMVGEILTPCPFCVPVNAAGDTTEVMWLRAEYHRLIAGRDALRKRVQTMAFALEPFAEFCDSHTEVEWLDGLALQDILEALDWDDFKAAADALGE